MSKIVPNGEVIERTRILANMTGRDLAQQAGVPASSIVRAERGLGVSVTTANGICKALGREFDDLFRIVRPGSAAGLPRGGVS